MRVFTSWLGGAVVFLSGFLLAWPGLAPAQQKEKALQTLNVGYPPSMGSVPAVVARERGFYKEEGFDFTLIVINSSAALKAQVAGEIHYTLFGGSTGILAAVGGMPIKVVMFLYERADYDFVVRPEINSGKDLIGKKVGVSDLSGSVYTTVRAFLKHYGVDPDKQVTILAVGREPVRLQALVAGTISATVFPTPQQFMAEREGMKILGSSEGILNVPLTGMTVAQSRLRAHPDEVRRVIRATLKGTQFYFKNPQPAQEILMRWLRIDREIARKSYERSLAVVSKDGTADEEALRNQINIARERVAGGREVAVFQVVDYSFLREVQKELGIGK